MPARAKGKSKSPRTDNDGAWKEILELYLRLILELCFPTVAAEVKWSAGFKFLDQELQQIVRDAKLGKQRVDKLIEVQLRGGEKRWILLHVEVASQPYVDLALTMYRYHHRLEDRYGRPVLSLAVLADDQPDWRPSVYEQELLGCSLCFKFPICKLLDLARDWKALERSSSPVTLLIMAHVRALETRGNMELRFQEKLALTRLLYARGYGRKEVLELYRLIDWLLGLPDELTLKYKEEVVRLEAAKSMPYVTSTQRIERKEGRKEGRQEGRIEAGKEFALNALRKRFGKLGASTESSIKELSLQKLKQLSVDFLDFEGIADLQTWLGKTRRSSTAKS